MDGEGAKAGQPSETGRIRHISPPEAVTILRRAKPSSLAFTDDRYLNLPPIDQTNRTTAQGLLLTQAGVPRDEIRGWSGDDIWNTFGSEARPKAYTVNGQTRDKALDEREALLERANALTAEVLGIPATQAEFFRKISTTDYYKYLEDFPPEGSEKPALNMEAITASLIHPQQLLGQSAPQLLAFVGRIDSLTGEDFDQILGLSQALLDKGRLQLDQLEEGYLPHPQAQKFRFMLNPPSFLPNYHRQRYFQYFKDAALAAMITRYTQAKGIDPEIMRFIKTVRFGKDTPLVQQISEQKHNLERIFDQIINDIVHRFDFGRGPSLYIPRIPLADGTMMNEQWLLDNVPPNYPEPKPEPEPEQPQPDQRRSGLFSRLRFPFKRR